MTQAGIRCFGPSQWCAQLEGSKAFAKVLEKTVDIDRLFAIAEGASELPEGSTLEKDSYGKQKVHLQKSGKRPVIAVARDEAFCFYYEDNLKALEKAGAEIVFFSPLHDGSVPKEADGLC